MSWDIDTASYADIGGRKEQQDRVAVLERPGACLMILADGMGGHEGGALAAQAVLDVASEQFDLNPRGAPMDLLRSIATGSHERINAMGAEKGLSPHSTCVLLHLGEDEAAWTHVGDSRLYRFKDGILKDRTMDHSVVELMRLQGRITEDEMKTHPDQNRLYEALGGAKPPEYEVSCANASESGGYLLASDGLWENADDAELEAVFEAQDLSGALKDLVARARERGGAECDNISVAAARHRRASRTLASRLRASLGI